MNRRDVLKSPGWLASLALAGESPSTRPEAPALNGAWEFRLDGESTWRTVTVPHTWQTTPGSEDYYGVAWYRRQFDAPRAWSAGVVRIEFEAVFHSAVVSINGKPAGEHIGKGYTAFTVDATGLLEWGKPNTILVRVDNSFFEQMLPRGRSSDWAHDGGIYRPVNILVSPKTYLERLEIDATPAAVEISAIVRGGPATVAYRIVDEATGATAAEGSHRVQPGDNRLPAARIANPKLWHFDHPHLYRLEARLDNGHELASTFGIRTFEARADGFYLNGDKVFLMGVERMAGSNPEYGMAEPSSWIDHDHDDMKTLNCIYTRVHWPQDRRVLDYCDRHGILMQTEVPTWGPKTFDGMSGEPSQAIMQNGLEQLHELIARDRNHPSIITWGLCNEIGGQNPPAYQFAKRMYEEAKRLDPRRLRSYASHSLFTTPGKDVSGLMDFVEWNEYYQSWQKGDPGTLRKTLAEIHAAFPNKLIVISEYGYCACTADRPEGDALRIDVLRGHNRVFREAPYVAGLIFFCYNDYRTHIGDRGTGVMKQRVHGVVDVYGHQKPSWAALRAESSPVESATAEQSRFTLTARKDVPAYPMRGYKVRALVYGQGEIPVERREAPLPAVAPGQTASVSFTFSEAEPARIVYDVLRPTGFSAWTATWRP